MRSHLVHSDLHVQPADERGRSTVPNLTCVRCRYVRNPLALPLVLAAIPAAFHVVRMAMGASMADATAAAWLMPGQVRLPRAPSVLLLRVPDRQRRKSRGISPFEH